MDIAPANLEDSLIVLDFGKKRKKDIRRLRKGKGKLTERLRRTIEDLKAQKTLPGDGQVVVVVVRERKKKSKGLLANW